MAGEVDKDASRGTHDILNWYDSTRPMFIDLVGDYAGKELFLVEGDSLLRECFEDDRIDFQGKSPTRHVLSGTNPFLIRHSIMRWHALLQSINIQHVTVISYCRDHLISALRGHPHFRALAFITVSI